jgi:hypothetical protein
MTTAGAGARVSIVCPRCARQFYATRDEINRSLFLGPKEADRLMLALREGRPSDRSKELVCPACKGATGWRQAVGRAGLVWRVLKTLAQLTRFLR